MFLAPTCNLPLQTYWSNLAYFTQSYVVMMVVLFDSTNVYRPGLAGSCQGHAAEVGLGLQPFGHQA